MGDASYVHVLEMHLSSLNLNGDYKLLSDERNDKGRYNRYQLSVGDRTVTGVGKTKKKAKEDAAESMYNILIDEERRQVQEKVEKTEEEDPIESLNELCRRHHLGSPRYEYETEILSNRDILYTVSCSILGIYEEVRCFKKERAKKKAAGGLLLKLREQEKVHAVYARLKAEEASKNNVNFKLPDGSVNTEAEHKVISKVRALQFVDYLKRSMTAVDMKKKPESYINEVKNPEVLFNRILKEMKVEFNVSFSHDGKNWVCCVEIYPLLFRMSTSHQDKTMAGKLGIRKVLRYMYAL